MLLNLIFIRHGATLGNEERRYIGQMTNQPLTEHGRQELIKRKSRGLYPHADGLFVSPLSRCVDTARIIYPMLVPITINSLMEQDFGSFEGKTYDQLKDDPTYRRWIDSAGMTAPPLGESGQDFSDRLDGALGQIAEDAKNKHIKTAAVITHGGCIMTMIAQHLPHYDKELDKYSYQAANGNGYIITMDTDTLIFQSIQPLG